MSRTIRRNNAKHLQASYVGRIDQVDRWDMSRYGVSTPEQALARKSAWFHGDSQSGIWSVPRWYRRERNRRVYRENKKEMLRCLKQGEWDDHTPTPYVSDAGWYWF